MMRPDIHERVFGILFLCRTNASCSSMAEALANAMGMGRIRGHSGGLHPAGNVHPLALAALSRRNFPAVPSRCKHWSEFTVADAPRIDIVITMGNGEIHEEIEEDIRLPGDPVFVHWTCADPAMVNDTQRRQAAAFAMACDQLAAKITAMARLPLNALGPVTIRDELERIGRQRS